MRIGILTFHRSINNGAVMQSFALSRLLASSFPEDKVEIIDYQMPKVDKTYTGKIQYYITGGSTLLKMKKLAYYVLHPYKLNDDKEKYKLFNRAVNEYLPLSSKKIFQDTTEDLNEYIKSNYDILVVGSDAVWNYTTRGFPNAYFPDVSLKCHKLSYAASCYGMDFDICSEQDKEEINKRLSTFDYIGVRDSATEDFINDVGCDVPPVHNCDPTAFLNVDSLPVDGQKIKEIMLKRGFDPKKPAIGIMGNDDMVRLVRMIFNDKYQLISLYNRVNGVDVQLYDINPFEWAYVFRYFKLVFTTYFHGTMLALRNGVPVICIALETSFSKKHIPKTLDVLRRVGYQEWYFHTDYKNENIDIIESKAKELVDTDLHDEIIGRIERESQYVSSFLKCIEDIKKKEK